MKEDSLPEKRRLVAAIEEERRRIGEEIHDTICQTLTGLTMLVERIARAVEAQRTVPSDTLNEVRTVVEKAISEARALARQFNPGSLEGAGLMTALHELAQDKNGAFICETPVFVASPEKALALYRIAEAVSHDAWDFAIRLEEQQASAVLTLQSKAPLPQSESPLELLRARAEVAGGTFETFETEDGTKIVCRLPLAAPSETQAD